MSWANQHVERLVEGLTVQFRPVGQSMSGRIESRQLVTVEPATAETVQVNDIVLCKVQGRHFLHLVKARRADGQLLIGNNRGGTNGWTKTVFGRVVAVS